MTNSQVFSPAKLKNLFRPDHASANEQNGQVTIIGGSDLFHGAPFLALKTASRIVDMVFFSSPAPSIGEIALQIKSQISSFIWIPWDEVEEYIKKSDCVLIGPGLKRYHQEADKPQAKPPTYDHAGTQTKFITEKLLRQFPQKQWVIDAGSLQVMDSQLIPPNAILTPNRKEFALLFSQNLEGKSQDTITSQVAQAAKTHHCIIVYKAAIAVVSDGNHTYLIKNGNAGLTKGGTGDVIAGLAVALAAKNPPLLAAAAATYITKATGDDLYQKVGANYNSDDLANRIPFTLHSLADTI